MNIISCVYFIKANLNFRCSNQGSFSGQLQIQNWKKLVCSLGKLTDFLVGNFKNTKIIYSLDVVKNVDLNIICILYTLCIASVRYWVHSKEQTDVGVFLETDIFPTLHWIFNEKINAHDVVFQSYHCSYCWHVSWTLIWSAHVNL